MDAAYPVRGTDRHQLYSLSTLGLFVLLCPLMDFLVRAKTLA